MAREPAKRQEAEAASAPARHETVTLRAVLLGLLMVCAVVGMTQTFNIRYHTSDVAGSVPPSAPTTFLLLYALLVAPLFTRFGKRIGLSRGEMLLIYAMMLVAGPIAHLFAIGYLLPHTVAPLYFLKQEPSWHLFQPVLPGWLGPDNAQAVEDFFHGNGGVVPWRAWLWPILAWSSLLIALFWVMLCINVLMHRQWIENERLVFPLTVIPLALAREERASYLRDPLSLTRQPLFWLGLAFVLLLQSPSRIHRYIPSIPDLPTQEIILIDGSKLSAPWSGLGLVEFDLLFWLIGIVYLLPKEIALSCWVFYFVGLLENVAAVMYGTTGEAPDVYSNAFPALYSQGAGAAFALTGIALYTARGHLRRVLGASAPRPGDSTISSPDLPMSYRTALLGAGVGFAFLLFWCHLGGMRWWVAALLFGLTLSYFFIFARIRAEAGLGMGVILWPKMMDEVMVTLVGAKNMTLSDLTLMEALRWLYFGPAIGSVMACQLEGLKLADAGGLRGWRVGGALALVATVTVPLAIAWTLHTFYSAGFESLHISRRSTSMVGTQIHHAYMIIIEQSDSPTGPQWGGVLAIGVGGLVTIALSALRAQFFWFPLHPIGYLAANSWGMHINWVSFFLGWLIKVLVTRYGGLKVYNRLLPFFLGLLVGDALSNALWGLMAWLTGTER